MFTIISLKRTDDKTITLYTEDKACHVTGEFALNAAALEAFITENHEMYFDFDMNFSFRAFRISDATVSLHLTWLCDAYEAYQQSFILPVSLIKRAIGGKTVTAVVDRFFCPYHRCVAEEIVRPVIYCGVA